MNASTMVTVGMAGFGVIAAGLFLYGQKRSGGSASTLLLSALGAAVWLALTFGLAASGALASFDAKPPPLVLTMVACVALGLGLGASPVGARWARALPLALLIGLQAFRLPLELVMHQAAEEGVMPPQMTFTGLNFEIVTALAAIPVAWLLSRRPEARGWAAAWTALSGVTLLAVLTIAAISTPLVHAFGTDPAHLNTWIAHPPFIWLPAGPVVFALFTEVVLVRRLLAERKPAQVVMVVPPSTTST